jgi:hypothetical protein
MGADAEARGGPGRLKSCGRAATIAYADSFGEAGNATGDYYLASAFDKVNDG